MQQTAAVLQVNITHIEARVFNRNSRAAPAGDVSAEVHGRRISKGGGQGDRADARCATPPYRLPNVMLTTSVCIKVEWLDEIARREDTCSPFLKFLNRLSGIYSELRCSSAH
jgi:hypothetical protein